MNGRSDFDSFMILLKALGYFAVIIIFIFFIARPWLFPSDNVYKCEKTPKMEAQALLLNELDHCESKFGGDYRDRNQQYCDVMLSSIKYLIEQGHFELSLSEMGIVEQKFNTTQNIQEVLERAKGTEERFNTEMDHIMAEVDKIIGDI